MKSLLKSEDFKWKSSMNSCALTHVSEYSEELIIDLQRMHGLWPENTRGMIIREKLLQFILVIFAKFSWKYPSNFFQFTERLHANYKLLDKLGINMNVSVYFCRWWKPPLSCELVPIFPIFLFHVPSSRPTPSSFGSPTAPLHYLETIKHEIYSWEAIKMLEMMNGHLRARFSCSVVVGVIMQNKRCCLLMLRQRVLMTIAY